MPARPKAATISPSSSQEVQPHVAAQGAGPGQSLLPVGPKGSGAQQQARLHCSHTTRQPSGISLCGLLDCSQLKEQQLNSSILTPKPLGSLIISYIENTSNTAVATLSG